MNPFLSLKAATSTLPALTASTNALTAKVTGINRFGLSGFASLELFPAENPKLLQLGYMDNHYVFTIADWKAQQLAKATPIVYQIKSKAHFAKLMSLKSEHRRDAYAMRTKAIEEIEDPSDDLVKLLANPNPSQSWAEFAYAVSVYWDFGNALCYGARLERGANKGKIRELYLLPTSLYGGKGPTIRGYDYFVDSSGVNSDIDGRDVLHLRRFNPDPELKGGQLWGMSKMAPARRLLTKSINSIEAEAEMMQNRGGRTIIFPKGLQYDDTVAAATLDGTAEIRKKLKQAGAGGIAGVGVELGAIELSMSPVDLDIIKSNAGTKEEFCALWHVNVTSVFSAMEGATFANLEEANKGSLRTGVLPDLSLLAQKLNQWLVPAYGEDRYIEFNTDVYPELQADKKEIFAWADSAGLTLDERRELAGFSAMGTPECQIPLYPSNLMPITDLLTVADPAPAKNDGTY